MRNSNNTKHGTNSGTHTDVNSNANNCSNNTSSISGDRLWNEILKAIVYTMP
ncbi:hypothetical protein AMURIS_02865 [Acetatifactor muris]|uniref:Uncharacterized protein n=1 Tax=Acetatifactor muris TaxID=879566 RepID=A0A2K4ZIA8_9FIRM|nr:hypothetical protein AMURIS_02865 [Acetatifactor muris]